jgi:hypothetical protein
VLDSVATERDDILQREQHYAMLGQQVVDGQNLKEQLRSRQEMVYKYQLYSSQLEEHSKEIGHHN